jgi:hypothetical protein
MNNPSDEYKLALQAIRNKDYSAASAFFKSVENQFADSDEFRILAETTELMLAVKEEIFKLEHQQVEV